MKEAFEKIKERLEEESHYSCFHCMDRAISIVSEVEAEYDNGWIDVKDRLPEKVGWYLVYTKPDKGHKSISKAEFCYGLIGNNFTPYWRGAGGRWGNVIAWMPLPEPYNPEKGE